MRGSITAGPRATAERRHGEQSPGDRRQSAGPRPGLPRPIAAGLNLGREHIESIDQSHLRCAALGVSRIERPDFSLIGRSDLQVARERNLRLHEHAAPVMEMLHEQIVDTDSMVVLTDATGTILHSIGDDDFLGRAAKVALAPGANWSESAKGTNAVGTALISEQPTLVYADEHYLHANHFLTCSAAPILDPRGNILGVLDVSGDHRSYHKHTMALVKMSARMIENHWLTDDYRNVMRLHFHARVEYIGTLMEGILAVNIDGKIVGANRGALEQLGLSGASLRMQSLTQLFGTTVNALVDRFRSPLARPMPVQLGSGRALHLHARFNWPVWTSLAEAVSQTPAQADPNPPTASLLPVPPLATLPSGTRAAPATDDALAALASGDAQFAGLVEKIRSVLDRDIPILLQGETGTGKALMAQAIHMDSARRAQPCITVNCAALPAAQIEAELFGSTDRQEGKPRGRAEPTPGGGQGGKLLQAHGGTLVLDDIGELPLGTQALLLRALEQRQVTVAGHGQAVALDVALICTTQRNLRTLVEAKRFREDLFYRLNGLTVRLPRLQERSDLLPLARRILQALSPQQPPQLSVEVVRLFESYQWPGNVRQLFNVLRAAAAMASGEPVIAHRHLPEDFIEEAQGPLPSKMQRLDFSALPMGPVGETTAPGGDSLNGHGPGHGTRPLEELEIEAIRQAVQAAGGNISAASKRLGVSRNTIYRKLRWNTASRP